MKQKNGNTLALVTEPLTEMVCSKCKGLLEVSDMAPLTPFDCPLCGESLTVRCMLDHFLIKRKLGGGCATKVFEAKDRKLERTVAIKIMRHEQATNELFAAAFLAEARVAAQISSSNVVRIYSVGKIGNIPYIVMEMVDGGSLERVLKEKKQAQDTWLLKVALARGLEDANRIDLLHQNLKPANILFNRQGTAKVSNFGLARLTRGEKTASRSILGTPYYLPPERIQQHEEDCRSDMYSLGATMYHVLTGQPPFDGNTPLDVVLARLKVMAPSVRNLRPDVSETTAKIVTRLLEVDPDQRYPQYQMLTSDLEQHLRKMEENIPAARGGGKTTVRRLGDRMTQTGKAVRNTNLGKAGAKSTAMGYTTLQRRGRQSSGAKTVWMTIVILAILGVLGYYLFDAGQKEKQRETGTVSRAAQ